MSGIKELMYGPIYYSWLWPIIGAGLIALMMAIIFVILHATRKKELKSLSNLQMKKNTGVDIVELRNRYLGWIAETEADFAARKIKASEAHQQISLLTRLYFSEARGFKANFMTLSELKKSRFKELASMIDEYYPYEFDTLERDSVKAAADKARKIIEAQA